ncbi:glyoxysomal fatty acid beta-oxidation multifunctional protein MFP-a, partial [Tanacetum coccineum]
CIHFLVGGFEVIEIVMFLCHMDLVAWASMQVKPKTNGKRAAYNYKVQLLISRVAQGLDHRILSQTLQICNTTEGHYTKSASTDGTISSQLTIKNHQRKQGHRLYVFLRPRLFIWSLQFEKEVPSGSEDDQVEDKIPLPQPQMHSCLLLNAIFIFVYHDGGEDVRKQSYECTGGIMDEKRIKCFFKIQKDLLEAARKPIVAAIDGPAFGGGLEIALPNMLVVDVEKFVSPEPFSHMNHSIFSKNLATISGVVSY